MSIDKGMVKEDVVYIYKMEYYSIIKKWNNAIFSNMDGPRDCHTNWSQLDRGRETLYGIPYMRNLKKWYKWTYKTETHRLREGTYGCWGGEMERRDS